MEQTGQKILPPPPDLNQQIHQQIHETDGSGLSSNSSSEEFNQQVSDKLTIMEQNIISSEPNIIPPKNNELNVLDHGFVNC